MECNNKIFEQRKLVDQKNYTMEMITWEIRMTFFSQCNNSYTDSMFVNSNFMNNLKSIISANVQILYRLRCPQNHTKSLVKIHILLLKIVNRIS